MTRNEFLRLPTGTALREDYDYGWHREGVVHAVEGRRSPHPMVTIRWGEPPNATEMLYSPLCESIRRIVRAGEPPAKPRRRRHVPYDPMLTPEETKAMKRDAMERERQRSIKEAEAARLARSKEEEANKIPVPATEVDPELLAALEACEQTPAVAASDEVLS